MIKNLELLILNSFWYSSQFTWVSATKLNIFRNFFMNSHSSAGSIQGLKQPTSAEWMER